jgi:hypothetical protein
MKHALTLAGVLISLLPLAATAVPTHKTASHNAATHKKTTHAATKYECAKCHMTYSAADAKKAHYVCSMDGGKLMPVRPSKSSVAKAAPAAMVAVRYKASGCGMIYSAADAKKYNYVCPMDHSKLVPVKAAGDKKPMSGMTM